MAAWTETSEHYSGIIRKIFFFYILSLGFYILVHITYYRLTLYLNCIYILQFIQLQIQCFLLMVTLFISIAYLHYSRLFHLSFSFLSFFYFNWLWFKHINYPQFSYHNVWILCSFGCVQCVYLIFHVIAWNKFRNWLWRNEFMNWTICCCLHAIKWEKERWNDANDDDENVHMVYIFHMYLYNSLNNHFISFAFSKC